MDSGLQLQIGIDNDIQSLPSGFGSRFVWLRVSRREN
jgi:hypothetical protein